MSTLGLVPEILARMSNVAMIGGMGNLDEGVHSFYIHRVGQDSPPIRNDKRDMRCLEFSVRPVASVSDSTNGHDWDQKRCVGDSKSGCTAT